MCKGGGLTAKQMEAVGRARARCVLWAAKWGLGQTPERENIAARPAAPSPQQSPSPAHIWPVTRKMLSMLAFTSARTSVSQLKELAAAAASLG